MELDLDTITIRKGVPLPGKRSVVKPDRTISDIIRSLKRGDSFVVPPAARCRVLAAANYLRRREMINFRLTSRKITEGGVPVIGFWRVEG